MEMLIRDLRIGLRVLVKHPGFTLAAIVCLALGIGATSALFSVIDAVLLRPLPYEEPERLITLWESNAQLGKERERPAPANVLDWRERSRSLDGLAAWYNFSTTLRAGGEAEEIATAQVTVDFFQLLRAEPLLGRTFRPEEVARMDPVAVMSHDLWQRRFGGDPDIVGRRLELDEESWEVVGVMPGGFAFPDTQVELWVPWDFETRYRATGGPTRSGRFVSTVARLADGVSLERAQADLDAIAAALAEDHPDTNTGWGVRLVPLKETIVGDSRRSLWVLAGAVTFLLGVACANVASLLLARSAARGREIALRSAMGASRRRVVRQLLTESVLLAVLGAVCGLVLARLGLALLPLIDSGDLPRLAGVGIDVRVLGFTILVALVTAVVFGLAPALFGSRTDLSQSLKEGGGGRGSTGTAASHRLLGTIIVAEIAVALLLLVGAGVLARSFLRLQAVDPGFEGDHLLTLRVSLDSRSYNTVPAISGYFSALRERLEALPGIEAAGAVTALPMYTINNDFDRPYYREDLPSPAEGEEPKADFRVVTPGYFEAMGIPLLRGRDFSDRDDEQAPYAIIVNQALASRTWPGEDPIGRRLMIDFFWNGWQSYEVVGVVGDTRFQGLKEEPEPELYAPHGRYSYTPMIIAARTEVPPEQLIEPVRREILALDPWQPPDHVSSMEELLAASLGRDRFALVLFGIFAAVALVLAATGIYGVLAYSVNQRQHELGVRMALGAAAPDLMRMTLGRGLRLAAIGVALGLGLSLLLARALSGLLYETRVSEPATLAAVALVFFVIAFAATLVPARRATRVDPVDVLRTE